MTLKRTKSVACQTTQRYSQTQRKSVACQTTQRYSQTQRKSVACQTTQRDSQKQNRHKKNKLKSVNSYSVPPVGYIDPPEYKHLMIERLRTTWDIARNNLQKAQQHQKTQHDKNAHPHNFKIGDEIMIFVPNSRKGISPKLYKPWHGMYKIHDITATNVLVSPTHKTGVTPKWISVSRCKAGPLKNDQITDSVKDDDPVGDKLDEPTEPTYAQLNKIIPSMQEQKNENTKTISVTPVTNETEVPNTEPKSEIQATTSAPTFNLRSRRIPKVLLLAFIVVLLLITNLSATTLDQFYTMTPKVDYPLYKCVEQATPVLLFPIEQNCSTINCATKKSDDHEVTIYNPVPPPHEIKGSLCYRIKEVCRFTYYFFGAQTSSCNSEYVPTTLDGCTNLWITKNSPDGILSQLDIALSGTTNKITENYEWPKSTYVEVTNSFLKETAIAAENDESPILTSVPTDSHCTLRSGNCPSANKGWLIWRKPQKLIGSCDLQEVGKAHCFTQNNIRCPGLKLEFDKLEKIEKCGKEMWTTKQGPLITLQPLNHHKSKAHFNEWLAFDKSYGYQKLIFQIEDLEHLTECLPLKLQCEMTNKFIRLTSVLIHIFPEVISIFTDDPHVSASLLGDALKISPCTNITTYKLLQDDPTIREIPIEYHHRGKSFTGFLLPFSHHIVQTASKARSNMTTKIFKLNDIEIDVTTKTVKHHKTVSMNLINFYMYHLKRLIIKDGGGENTEHHRDILHSIAQNVFDQQLSQNTFKWMKEGHPFLGMPTKLYAFLHLFFWLCTLAAFTATFFFCCISRRLYQPIWKFFRSIQTRLQQRHYQNRVPHEINSNIATEIDQAPSSSNLIARNHQNFELLLQENKNYPEIPPLRF
jgi:hypothetical protein